MLVEDERCYFYQCDQIGTPLALVDEQGSVVWQACYDTYGRAHIEVESVGNPLRFQGQYHDVETGLHYNLARYYDPRTGRFIQPDPIGLLGGVNHYQYAPNPVMWVDPHGLCAKEDTPAIKAGVNDTQPQQPMFYAMGSGNYASAVKTASPTYQLHAIAPDAVQQVGIDYALGATEMLAAGAYNTAVDAVAGLAGLAQLAFGDLEQSSTLIQSIQDKYSYVPQSRGAHQIINNVSGYVEAYADTMESLGSATLEHTGSPLAATLVQLAPEIVMTAWGGRVAMKSVGKGLVPSTTTNMAGARFNEIVSSVDGKVLGNYSILDNGPLSAGATTRLELNDSLAATFSGGRYAEIELADDLVVYRAWHPDQAKEFGAFWSLEKPAGSLQTRIDSALLPEWGKLKNNPVHRQQATQYTKAVIPKGTKIFIGEVGSQGSPWVGSGSQLLIKDSAVLPDWKVGGGYLQ